MKKTLLIVLTLVIIAASGGAIYYYTKTKETQNNELENKIDTASRDYFEKYISANDSANTYMVTLEDLEKANQNGENYDLKGLEKCDKTKTFSNVTIDYQTGKAKKTQVELKC